MPRDPKRRFTAAAYRAELASERERTDREQRLLRDDAVSMDLMGDRWEEFLKRHPNLKPESRNDVTVAVEAIGEEWVARWTVAEQGGALVVRSLHLEPLTLGTPAGGITSDLLRDLSPATALAAAYAGPTESAPSHRIIADFHARERRERGPHDEPARRSRAGRPPVPEDELIEVALAYLAELKRGRGVTARLVNRFDMSEGAIRDRIRMCRDPQRGLLTPTKQGQRGGGPGPRLLELMPELAAPRIQRQTRDDEGSDHGREDA